MKALYRTFTVGQLIVSLLFIVCAGTLVIFAVSELWHAITAGGEVRARLNGVLESIALLTIAVASLELGQTILEEEVQRDAHMSAPTRVRRFLSRFLVVLVVSLAIECLVAVFQFIHEAPENLPYAASIGVAAAALLAAWGVFIRFNRAAEELEPEAMAQAKGEDRKMDEAKR